LDYGTKLEPEFKPEPPLRSRSNNSELKPELALENEHDVNEVPGTDIGTSVEYKSENIGFEV
jgi:hypothetical protein